MRRKPERSYRLCSTTQILLPPDQKSARHYLHFGSYYQYLDKFFFFFFGKKGTLSAFRLSVSNKTYYRGQLFPVLEGVTLKCQNFSICPF